MLVDVFEKLLAFRETFRLWKRTIESQKTASFPVFNQFLENIEVCFDDVQLVINKHLASLKNFITRIWLSPKRQKNWNGCAIHLLLMLIHCRKAAKLFLDFKRNLLTFSATVYNLGQFWTKIKNETIIVGTYAVKALLLFLTNCLCECGFSVLAQIKTKTRNCLGSLKTTWDWLWAILFQFLTKLWKRYKIRAYID